MGEVSRSETEEILITDEERTNLASVHVQFMQPAEIFLTLNTILSARLEAPQVLLMDLSPSSVLASVARGQDKIGLWLSI
ncbi:unnamed protein product [marine sediment metagenome]|uniref:Uncharacterized protein n=1 Tax=marine sediment metagenome TaxID=412755 RepID=X1ABR2_9ZZZZ